MKTLLMVIILTCCKAMATNAQLYYGANIGVGVGKSWDGKAKKVRNGINDLYLCVPVGYTTHNLLFEISPQMNYSLTQSISGLIGGKVDISEDWGLHFLVGTKDDILYSPHPLQVIHYFNPQSTLRVWIGNFNVQGSFIKRKENSSVEIGIGVIGF